MLKIEKIEDKSLNLDVQGQGCHDDCYIGAHWELKANFNTMGCEWHNAVQEYDVILCGAL